MAIIDEDSDTKIDYCLDYLTGEFMDALMQEFSAYQLEEIANNVIQDCGLAEDEDY